MAHLLHELKEELDWAERELLAGERQFAELEVRLKSKLEAPGGADNHDALVQEFAEQKQALNLNELYAIMTRAARRCSLLTRVFETGSGHNTAEDIAIALKNGLLFRQGDAGPEMDRIIAKLSEALHAYFNVHFDDESDTLVRTAWLEVENDLREKGRKI